MARIIFIIFLSINVQLCAQSYVLDKENYLTSDEVARVDSMLATFHKRTGKVVLMSTDSLNIRDSSYSNELYNRYYSDSVNSGKLIILLMSRKNQLVQLTTSRQLLDKISHEKMLEIIQAGAPSLQAKRREEGVTLILKKTMEVMESL